MRCDLFCSVVDNFGDIGICWRLARQLQTEHQWQVTLWVDDLASFQKICHSVKPDLASQLQHDVLVRHWTAVLPELTAADRPDLVIEASSLHYSAILFTVDGFFLLTNLCG